MLRSERFCGISWGVTFALYLLLAAKVSWAELSLGVVVGGFTTAALFIARRCSSHHFQIPAHSLGKLLRVPLRMLIDCGIVFLAILRRPFLARGSGRFRERDFHPGNEQPTSRARRALVILGIACAPNTIPLGVLPNDQLLVHELVPQPPQVRDPEWPL